MVLFLTNGVLFNYLRSLERQKVLRKIQQTQRTLDSGVNAEGEKLKKKQRKALEEDLLERRVDLNYILVRTRTLPFGREDES